MQLFMSRFSAYPKRGRTLSGETVPDVHTVAVLEEALDAALWPDYPRTAEEPTTR